MYLSQKDIRERDIQKFARREFEEMLTGQDSAHPYSNCPILRLLALHSRKMHQPKSDPNYDPKDPSEPLYGLSVFQASEVLGSQHSDRATGHSRDEILALHGMHLVSPEDESEENERFRNQEYKFPKKN